MTSNQHVDKIIFLQPVGQPLYIPWLTSFLLAWTHVTVRIDSEQRGSQLKMWRARLLLAGMLNTGVLRRPILSWCYKWRRVQSAREL